MAKKVVYAVSQGSYSDYGIVAIFSTRYRAKKFADFLGDGMVEEYEVNPEKCENRLPCWKVYMDRNGDGASVEKLSNSFHWDSDQKASWLKNGWYKYPNRMYHRHGPTWECFCRARDEEHAIKIANEKRTQDIAINGEPDPVYRDDEGRIIETGEF